MSVPVRGEETSKKPLTKDAHAMAVSMLRGCAIHPVVLLYHYEHSLPHHYEHSFTCWKFISSKMLRRLRYTKVTEIHPFQAAFCFLLPFSWGPSSRMLWTRVMRPIPHDSTHLLSNNLPRRRKQRCWWCYNNLFAPYLGAEISMFWREKIIGNDFCSEIKISDFFCSIRIFFLDLDWLDFFILHYWYLKIVWWQKCFGLPRCKLCRPSPES